MQRYIILLFLIQNTDIRFDDASIYNTNIQYKSTIENANKSFLIWYGD